ncbi:MAG: ATP-binding cassette domain-containing protein [Magnetococcales bacterium]|nr:ATP-binding cassette domain-containing protein [Magnetococcales bacterium]
MLLDKLVAQTRWYAKLGILPFSQQTLQDSLLVTATIHFLSLAVPITLMQVYDRILPNEAGSTLFWLVFGAVIALLMDGMLRWARFVISAWNTARFEYLIGNDTVSRILSSRLEDFEKNGIGVHLDRLGSVSGLGSFYAGQLPMILFDMPFAAIFLVAIWYLGQNIVFFPLAMAGIYFLILYYARKKYEQAKIQQIATNDRRFNFIIETLSGLHLIKAQTLEEQMLRRHERLQEASGEANMEMTYWNTLPNTLSGAFSYLTMFGLIAVGSSSVISGELTFGGITACTMLAGRAMQPIQNAFGFWFRFADVKIASDQLRSLANLRPETSSGAPPFPKNIEGSLCIDDLSFRFQPELPYIFHHAHLVVPSKSMTVILGNSSTGTTTLMYLLMGTLKPESGHVRIDDYNLAEWDHTDPHGWLAYLPANGTLFKGSILDNIALFNTSHRATALDAAAMLGLDEPIAALPMGYETQVDSQAANFLPSGLIQRICLARALVVRPRILLLDKTNAVMDRESEQIFFWLMNHLKGRCTIVMATNHPTLLAMADRVYEIQNGTLVEVQGVVRRERKDTNGQL